MAAFGKSKKVHLYSSFWSKLVCTLNGLFPWEVACAFLLIIFLQLSQTFEATRVFEHLCSLGVKPNTMSYSLLVDAHLINRDPKSAISVLNAMVKSRDNPFFSFLVGSISLHAHRHLVCYGRLKRVSPRQKRH